MHFNDLSKKLKFIDKDTICLLNKEALKMQKKIKYPFYMTKNDYFVIQQRSHYLNTSFAHKTDFLFGMFTTFETCAFIVHRMMSN